MIIIVDFGSQTTHLISRRLREKSILTEIVDPDKLLEILEQKKIAGIILSGGPGDAYKKDALTLEREIFDLGIPILGICYGEQVIAEVLGGKVKPGKKKEFGPAKLKIIKSLV